MFKVNNKKNGIWTFFTQCKGSKEQKSFVPRKFTTRKITKNLLKMVIETSETLIA